MKKKAELDCYIMIKTKLYYDINKLNYYKLI